MRLLFIFAAIFTLLGCQSLPKPGSDSEPGSSHVSEHRIAGSTARFLNATIIRNIRVGDLQIRQVRRKAATCRSGFIDHIELNGPINGDSLIVIKKILSDFPDCISPSGAKGSIIVMMNSPGGYLEDGYGLGELFRVNRVSTLIAPGQTCASSCAIAFLGGIHRAVAGDGSLLFHSPYKDTGMNIECSTKNASHRLKNYFSTMLGSMRGELLFDRAMSYCSLRTGWIINSDAADIFGITTNKYD